MSLKRAAESIGSASKRTLLDAVRELFSRVDLILILVGGAGKASFRLCAVCKSISNSGTFHFSSWPRANVSRHGLRIRVLTVKEYLVACGNLHLPKFVL